MKKRRHIQIEGRRKSKGVQTSFEAPGKTATNDSSPRLLTYSFFAKFSSLHIITVLFILAVAARDVAIPVPSSFSSPPPSFSLPSPPLHSHPFFVGAAAASTRNEEKRVKDNGGSAIKRMSLPPDFSSLSSSSSSSSVLTSDDPFTEALQSILQPPTTTTTAITTAPSMLLDWRVCIDAVADHYVPRAAESLEGSLGGKEGSASGVGMLEGEPVSDRGRGGEGEGKISSRSGITSQEGDGSSPDAFVWRSTPLAARCGLRYFRPQDVRRELLFSPASSSISSFSSSSTSSSSSAVVAQPLSPLLHSHSQAYYYRPLLAFAGDSTALRAFVTAVNTVAKPLQIRAIVKVASVPPRWPLVAFEPPFQRLEDIDPKTGTPLQQGNENQPLTPSGDSRDESGGGENGDKNGGRKRTDTTAASSRSTDNPESPRAPFDVVFYNMRYAYFGPEVLRDALQRACRTGPYASSYFNNTTPQTPPPPGGGGGSGGGSTSRSAGSGASRASSTSSSGISSSSGSSPHGGDGGFMFITIGNWDLNWRTHATEPVPGLRVKFNLQAAVEYWTHYLREMFVVIGDELEVCREQWEQWRDQNHQRRRHTSNQNRQRGADDKDAGPASQDQAQHTQQGQRPPPPPRPPIVIIREQFLPNCAAPRFSGNSRVRNLKRCRRLLLPTVLPIYRRVVRGLAAAVNVPVIPVDHLFTNSSKYCAMSDGIHLDPACMRHEQQLLFAAAAVAVGSSSSSSPEQSLSLLSGHTSSSHRSRKALAQDDEGTTTAAASATAAVGGTSAHAPRWIRQGYNPLLAFAASVASVTGGTGSRRTSSAAAAPPSSFPPATSSSLFVSLADAALPSGTWMVDEASFRTWQRATTVAGRAAELLLESLRHPSKEGGGRAEDVHYDGIGGEHRSTARLVREFRRLSIIPASAAPSSPNGTMYAAASSASRFLRTLRTMLQRDDDGDGSLRPAAAAGKGNGGRGGDTTSVYHTAAAVVAETSGLLLNKHSSKNISSKHSTPSRDKDDMRMDRHHRPAHPPKSDAASSPPTAAAKEEGANDKEEGDTVVGSASSSTSSSSSSARPGSPRSPPAATAGGGGGGAATTMTTAPFEVLDLGGSGAGVLTASVLCAVLAMAVLAGGRLLRRRRGGGAAVPPPAPTPTLAAPAFTTAEAGPPMPLLTSAANVSPAPPPPQG